MNLALEVEIAPVGHAAPQRSAPHVEFFWIRAVRVFDKPNSIIDNVAVRLNTYVVTAAFSLRRLFNFLFEFKSIYVCYYILFHYLN